MLTDRSGPRPEGVAQAKQLCDELLEKVKADYQAFKDRPPPNRFGEREGGYGGGRPGYGERGDRGDRGDRDRSQSYGYGAAPNSGAVGYGGYGSHGAPAVDTVMSPNSAAAPADANAQAFDYNTMQAWAVYYQANPDQDPYMSYGGYSAFVTQYYYGGQAGATQSPAPGAGGAPPPPPPPSDSYGTAPPPPPPAPAGSPGGYSAVRIPLYIEQ